MESPAAVHGNNPPEAPVDQIFIGGYTAEMGGQSVGITGFRSTRSDPSRPAFEPLAGAEVVSPSYLLADPIRPLLFAVSEAADGPVTSLRIGPEGELTVISSVPSGQSGGCHLALDPSGRFLVAAHYDSGAVTSYRLTDDGTLSGPVSTLLLTGSGPDPERQDHAYAHQVVFDAGVMLVADLGGDTLHRLRIDSDGVLSEPLSPVQLPAGSGPRHLVVVEDNLIVACELNAELWVARRTGDGWIQTARIPSSTAVTAERIYPSAIRTDGNSVFVANRGPDTVAVFSLGEEPGSLQLITEFGSGGSWPRDLVLNAGQIWVTNQNSSQVSVFARSGGADGYRLEREFGSPSPASIVLRTVPVTQVA